MHSKKEGKRKKGRKMKNWIWIVTIETKNTDEPEIWVFRTETEAHHFAAYLVLMETASNADSEVWKNIFKKYQNGEYIEACEVWWTEGFDGLDNEVFVNVNKRCYAVGPTPEEEEELRKEAVAEE